VMCSDMPEMQDERVVWSGLRLGDRALVRAFKQGGGDGVLSFTPWPDQPMKLPVPAGGKIYLLRRVGTRVVVEKG